MNEISGIGLAIVIVLLIPFLWSALIWALRYGIYSLSPADHPEDQTEKLFLLLVIAPAVMGACFYAGAVLFPDKIAILQIPFAPAGDQTPLAVSAHFQLASAKASWTPPIFLAVIMIYVVGVSAWFARFCRTQIQLNRIVTAAKKPLHSLGCDVLITNSQVSPFIDMTGRIILPRVLINQLSPAQLDLIIQHERAHLERGDARYFLLLAVIDILFWFNPFIRLQTSKCRLACEIACDMAVTAKAPESRKSYAMTLLCVLEIIAGAGRIDAPAFFSLRRKGEFRMRVIEIMRPSEAKGRRPKRLVMAVIAVLAAPVAAVQLAYADASASKAPAFSALIVQGKITSSYGMQTSPFTGERQLHVGVDIKAPLDTPVKAPAAGHVMQTRTDPGGYGKVMEVAHADGFITRYVHLNSFVAEEGDKVAAGQIIAKVGSTGRSTGPHLHVEVIKDGEHIDPASVLILPRQD